MLLLILLGKDFGRVERDGITTFNFTIRNVEGVTISKFKGCIIFWFVVSFSSNTR